jgi:hypothetical protein
MHIKRSGLLIGGLIAAVAASFLRTHHPAAQPVGPGAPMAPAMSVSPAGQVCDPSLWAHVYAGRFGKPQDRLRVNHPCATITGVIDPVHPPAREADGDWHIRLIVDPPFAVMLNAKNLSGQHGDLVLEPVCSNQVTQRDTLDEGVCDGFTQQIYRPAMIGQHVMVTGVYVTDMEHGWNEIHPVTSIVIIP